MAAEEIHGSAVAQAGQSPLCHRYPGVGQLPGTGRRLIPERLVFNADHPRRWYGDSSGELRY